MSATGVDDLGRVWEQVKDWPAGLQVSLARRLLDAADTSSEPPPADPYTIPIPGEPPGTYLRFARPHPPDPEVVAYWKSIGADGPPIGIEELHALQIAEGADPTVPAARIEIERMREE